MTLPNDHTIGVSRQNPSPDTMCAINDEATGMFVDALSHSPLWASSLVVLTEDDPPGRRRSRRLSPHTPGAHVSLGEARLRVADAHRRGLAAQGLRPRLRPALSQPRGEERGPALRRLQIPIACGSGATPAEKRLTDSWDFQNVDQQPGLGDQVWRWMRGRQLTVLPPRLEAQIEARRARKAQGLPLEQDGDD